MLNPIFALKKSFGAIKIKIKLFENWRKKKKEERRRRRRRKKKKEEERRRKKKKPGQENRPFYRPAFGHPNSEFNISVWPK